MKMDFAELKSIKADIGKKEITVSFTVGMNQETMRVAEILSTYLGSKEETATSMTVDIVPHQATLFPPSDNGSDLDEEHSIEEAEGETDAILK